MSTSLIVITLSLHSIYGIQVTKEASYVMEGCAVETTGAPTIVLNGSCNDNVQSVIDNFKYEHPELPFLVVMDGESLSKA